MNFIKDKYGDIINLDRVTHIRFERKGFLSCGGARLWSGNSLVAFIEGDDPIFNKIQEMGKK